jgi:hypothetical protein
MVLGVLALVAVTGAVRAGRWVAKEREVVSIHLFRYPGSVCDRYRENPFTAQVQEIEAVSDSDLRVHLAQVRSGVTGSFVGRSTTPDDARGPLQDLADSLTRAGSAGGFSSAEDAAAAVDEVLRAACR